MKTGVDLSPLNSQIEKYMVSVEHLDVVRCTHSMKISLEVQSEHLAFIVSQIVDALNSKGVQVNCRQSLKIDLTTLDAKQEALKKELEQLGIQKEHFHNSINRMMFLAQGKNTSLSPKPPCLLMSISRL